VELRTNRKSSQSSSIDHNVQSPEANAPPVLRIVHSDKTDGEHFKCGNCQPSEESQPVIEIEKSLGPRALGGFQSLLPILGRQLKLTTNWLTSSLSASNVFGHQWWRVVLRDLVGLSCLCLVFLVSYFASYYLRFDGDTWFWVEK